MHCKLELDSQPLEHGLVNQREASIITGYSQYWLQKKRVTGGGPPFVKKGYFVYYISSELAKFKKPPRRKRLVRKLDETRANHV